MDKVITIHQPDFLPWAGFFHRWIVSDLLIILDDVQFIRRGWHHRDKIKTAQGAKWLTVPVKKKGRYFDTINRIEINDAEDWKKGHLNQIHSAYGKAPRFHAVFPQLEKIYSKPWRYLMDLNLELLKFMAVELGIRAPFCMASDFSIDLKGTEKLLALIQTVQGTAYMTGLGSKDYLKEDLFRAQGVPVIWSPYTCPEYPQLHDGFVPYLSILDAMMMLSPQEIKRLCSGDTDHAQMYA